MVTLQWIAPKLSVSSSSSDSTFIVEFYVFILLCAWVCFWLTIKVSIKSPTVFTNSLPRPLRILWIISLHFPWIEQRTSIRFLLFLIVSSSLISLVLCHLWSSHIALFAFFIRSLSLCRCFLYRVFQNRWSTLDRAYRRPENKASEK